MYDFAHGRLNFEQFPAYPGLNLRKFCAARRGGLSGGARRHSRFEFIFETFLLNSWSRLAA
jgi:hypothetical protein